MIAKNQVRSRAGKRRRVANESIAPSAVHVARKQAHSKVKLWNLKHTSAMNSDAMNAGISASRLSRNRQFRNRVYMVGPSLMGELTVVLRVCPNRSAP
jgi:hypothetical protein